MREILFRGKRNDNMEWVYGFPFVSSASQVGIGKWDGRAEMNSVEDDEWSRWDIYDLFVPKVDHKTVGQYTGLQDKNGVKIFEGDVLKIAKLMDFIGTYYGHTLKYPCNVLVKWDRCAWCWETIEREKYFIHFPDTWCHYECEVIGNIYDNPELLNQSGS